MHFQLTRRTSLTIGPLRPNKTIEKPPARNAFRTAAPFRHKHVLDKTTQVYPMCPPEWDMTPTEYKDTAAVHKGKQGGLAVGLTAYGAGAGGWGLWHLGTLPSDVLSSVADWASLGAATTGMCTLIGMAVTIPEAVRAIQRDITVLDHRNPAAVAYADKLPDDIRSLLWHITHTKGEDTDAEWNRRLTLAFETAVALNQIGEETGDWSLPTLIEHGRAEVVALMDFGLSLNDTKARQSASLILAALQRLDGTLPTNGGLTKKSLRQVWSDSVQTHDRVSNEWTDMVTDPLNALTHSALFDVNETRTAQFVEVYGTAQDLRVMHGKSFPTDEPDAAKDYHSVVRKTDTAWTEALRYSEHITFDWLPANEATYARRAAAFLAVAADESATIHERATAAGMAADLLRKVKSFLLPPTAIHALETQMRLELMPAEVSAVKTG